MNAKKAALAAFSRLSHEAQRSLALREISYPFVKLIRSAMVK